MYQSYLYTTSPDVLSAMVVTAAVVYLLVWLCNARQLRKFKKGELDPDDFFLKSRRAKGIFAVGLIGLIVLLVLLFSLVPKYL